MAGVRSTKNFLISGDGFETNFILGNLTIKFELFLFRWVMIHIICIKPAKEIEKLKYLAKNV